MLELSFLNCHGYRFMNLSNLEELGCLSSALLSLRNLQTLVVDLSGCGQVSIEARMELHQSIKLLKRLRGSLDSWINIEGLPDEIWFPHFTRFAFGAIKSLCSCGFIWQMRRLSTRQLPVNSMYCQATRFGRSSASSDDSAAESESVDHSIEQGVFDENRPFPCSHPACSFFHCSERGYCERHRWLGLGKRICVATNSCRQNVELAVLILAQAVVEVESRSLLFLIALSLLPVASYSISQSTGVSGTLIFLFLALTAIVSIVCTTVRLNRMHALSKKLEVESEAVYAKNLKNDMSRVFGDQGTLDITQPDVTSLKEHFIEARRNLHDFNKMCCLPLQEFLEEQHSISRRDLQPSLMTLPAAQEAVMREGEPSRIFDLLYCNVVFEDWEEMLSAWCFLKTRSESHDLGGVELVRTRDFFALAHSGVRSAEMVFRINNYFATIRFLEASLTELECQLDGVHRLAEQMGLVTGRSWVDSVPIFRRPTRQSRLLVAVVFSLRAISSLAAAYLAGQYFVRYSPPNIRSSLPDIVRDAFALKQIVVEPRDSKLLEIEASDSHRWEETLLQLLPPLLLSLPYLALTIVFLSDLRRCGSSHVKLKPLKPTQLLYEAYFGIEGKIYGFKVAMLQIFTVMLQALGKLQILGGIVSFALHSARKHAHAFEGCFWAFVGFLILNSIYPSILLAFPSVKWVRVSAAMMDAVLDVAYTSTYLIITVLAIYELQLDQTISGNFGHEASVNFQAELDPSFAFPSDFLGFFAVYYSLAHVCTICRALERSSQSGAFQLWQSSWRFSSSKRSRRCCKALYFVCIEVFSPQFSHFWSFGNLLLKYSILQLYTNIVFTAYQWQT